MAMFFVGVGMFLYIWRMSKERVETMQFDAVYEGIAQVFQVDPLIIRYLAVDGKEVTKRVNLRIQPVIPAGVFVTIVLENNEIVRVSKENRVS